MIGSKSVRNHAPLQKLYAIAALSVASWLVGANAVEAKARQVSVEEPRALAAAIYELEKRHGVLITYEDPAYLHASDLADGTHHFPDYQGVQPVMVPRAARLATSYFSPDGLGGADWLPVVQQLIDAHRESRNPGEFRVEQGSGMLHVIPTAVADDDGRMAAQIPILDTPISLLMREAGGLDALAAIKEAVNAVSPRRLLIGMAPLELIDKKRVRMRFTDQPARAALAGLMAQIGENLSWAVFYDPYLDAFVLNIDLIAKKAG